MDSRTGQIVGRVGEPALGADAEAVGRPAAGRTRRGLSSDGRCARAFRRERGRRLGEIAAREGIDTVMVRRACDLAFLSTDMIEAILAGDQPVELNSEAVKLAYPLPIGWEEQRRVLGFG